MPVKILRGASDDILEQVIAVLRNYEATHPDAVIDLYRQNSVSIRVRIVDSEFQGMSKKERNDLVWDYLDTLSEDAQADISMLVLLAPTEVEKSMGNLEFRKSGSFGISQPNSFSAYFCLGRGRISLFSRLPVYSRHRSFPVAIPASVS